MGAVRNALQALPFPLHLQLFRPPPWLLQKPDALRLPLVHPPLLERGVAVQGRQRVSPSWVLMRSSLPPPAVRWERSGRGAARASASVSVGDSAAYSLTGVGVVGSSCSQESLALTDPPPVASSVSAGRNRRSRSREIRGSTGDHSHSCSSRSFPS